MRKIKVLNSWDQIQLLGSETKVAILELGLQPVTVSEMAEALGVPRTRLYHHVNLLTKNGLLEVVKTRQVGPVVESQYRAAALSYRTSKRLRASLSAEEAGAAVISVVFGPAKAEFIRALKNGVFNLADSKNQRRVHVSRYLMNLTPDELHELITEIDKLYSRFDPTPDIKRAGTIPVAGVSLIHPRLKRAE